MIFQKGSALLVGGFNPFEKYARQISPGIGVKTQKHLKPPPSRHIQPKKHEHFEPKGMEVFLVDKFSFSIRVLMASGEAPPLVFVEFSSKSRPAYQLRFPMFFCKSNGSKHISGQITIIPKPELRGFWGGFPY